MVVLKDFLENSTIHGLVYISTTKGLSRLFWALVVFTGFSGAGILIYQSFQSWAESPISTTIETLPISEITFPKVTVCPPKNSFTNLNYDINKADSMNFDNATRKKLIEATKLLLHDFHYDEVMKNLDIIIEEERYRNWYNGYSAIKLPKFIKETGQIEYSIETTKTDGSIKSTKFRLIEQKSKKLLNVKSVVKIIIPKNFRKVKSFYENCF